jgi:hypothetical protein
MHQGIHHRVDECVLFGRQEVRVDILVHSDIRLEAATSTSMIVPECSFRAFVIPILYIVVIAVA